MSDKISNDPFFCSCPQHFDGITYRLTELADTRIRDLNEGERTFSEVKREFERAEREAKIAGYTLLKRFFFGMVSGVLEMRRGNLDRAKRAFRRAKNRYVNQVAGMKAVLPDEEE